MDTVTHLVFGGCIAAAIAPPRHRRAALLLGAALGTLPDLDVFPLLLADPVTRFTAHRGATHSLFVLPFVALLAWGLLRWRYRPSRDAPWRWLALCALVLIAHPLLDAFTVYGTYLFWPLQRPPVMIASLFIIDPLFTLPLLVAVVVAWRWRERPRATAWLLMGLASCGVYLGWTLLAKFTLEHGIRAQYAARGIDELQLLTVPTPFNSLVWRVLVIGADGYAEGFHSYLAAGDRLELQTYPAIRAGLAELRGSHALDRLQRFTRGFYTIEERDGRLVFTDLRMGAEPDYVFRFVVGERRGGAMVALDPPQQLPWPRNIRAQITRAWRRLTLGASPSPQPSAHRVGFSPPSAPKWWAEAHPMTNNLESAGPRLNAIGVKSANLTPGVVPCQSS